MRASVQGTLFLMNTFVSKYLHLIAICVMRCISIKTSHVILESDCIFHLSPRLSTSHHGGILRVCLLHFSS